MDSQDSDFPWHEAEKDLMAGIDSSVPHSARIWNYWLGGKDNYAIDRSTGDRYCEIFPGIVGIARAARIFHTRAVRYLAGERSIHQFLDIGTGLPTANNTHEVAQQTTPHSRVVYVDNDPLVLAHANALLTSTPPGVTDYIEADIREPDAILRAAADTLDFTRPIALMLMGIMGHITDDAHAYSIVGHLLAGLPPGSFLVLRDATNTDTTFGGAQELYNQSGAAPYKLRSPQQIARFFDTLQLIEPGLVTPLEWKPDPGEEPVRVEMACGVGQKK
ncbi:SAM-dependent methyltransferase [Actinoallomurus acaciae]|uniref:SAM-dependent methyltransferase n=1 Tax=Actinoallomurus acaciae TaxID=502577 RepID=UPI00366FD501